MFAFQKKKSLTRTTVVTHWLNLTIVTNHNFDTWEAIVKEY